MEDNLIFFEKLECHPQKKLKTTSTKKEDYLNKNNNKTEDDHKKKNGRLPQKNKNV
jgi:hypothetical protein